LENGKKTHAAKEKSIACEFMAIYELEPEL
jgi:hypothetical protein